jgi:D-alanyl-D-alanine carboxypeptidase
VQSIVRRTPDDASWGPWLFLSVATLAMALIVSLAAVTAVGCGSDSNAGDATELPLSPTDEPTATETPEQASATPTPAPTEAEPSPTPTLTPTLTPEPDGNGVEEPGYVDNSPEVPCTIGAPLGQNARVARDCVIGPLVAVEGYLLNDGAAAAYEEMKAAAAADGIDIFIVSGYRDFDTQMQLYLAEVAAYGPDQNTTAKPGHSEHQLGTTVDLNDLSQEFGSTPAGIWLQQNAGRFGFQMSYPPGNAAGYAYEPWHWRWWG